MLAFLGPASADDTNRVVVARRPHDNEKATSDRSDGEETVLRFGMGLVKDLEVVRARNKELFRLLEGDIVLPPVGKVLGFR